MQDRHIDLYLDGVLQMSYDDPAPAADVFQVVTRDEDSGDIVAKVVNISAVTQRTQVEVSDVEIAPTGPVTTIVAPPGATNTKAAPSTVKPRSRASSAAVVGRSPTTSPPYSVTFLRMHTAEGHGAPTVDDAPGRRPTVGGWRRPRRRSRPRRPTTARSSAGDVGRRRFVDADASPAGRRSRRRPHRRVRATDAAGNVVEVRPATLRLDAIAPGVRGQLRRAAPHGHPTATDQGSGVDRIEYRLGTGPWTTYTAPVQVGAATTVDYRATDRLGRVEQPGTLAVPAPGTSLAASSTAAVTVEDPVRLGSPVKVNVTVTAQGATPTGTVTLTDQSGTLATGTLADGRAVLEVASTELGVGSHELTVAYAGDSARAASLDTVTVVVAKASSTTRARVKHHTPSARKAVVIVKVAAAVDAEGTVRIKVRTGKKVTTRTVTLHDGRARLVLRGLATGSHRITATYAGSPDVARSSDSTVLRVTRAGR